MSARKTAAGMLSMIDKFLSDPETIHTKEARKLWDVLSALRGPDADWSNDLDEDKFATTSVVRKTAFPKAFSRKRYDNLYISVQGHSFGADDTDVRAKRRTAQMTLGQSGHFTSHVQRAFEALKLKWKEKN